MEQFAHWLKTNVQKIGFNRYQFNGQIFTQNDMLKYFRKHEQIYS